MQFLQTSPLFVVLLFVICGIGHGNEATSLTSIYEDLSILSRVTNAISLEIGALRKSIKVREVITEILRVDTGNFSELVKIDPTYLMNTLVRLHFISTNVKKGQNGKLSNIDLAQTSKQSDLVSSIIQKFNENTVLDEGTVMKSVYASKDLLKICDTKLVQTASDFSDMLNEIGAKTFDVEKNLVENISKSMQEIIYCSTKVEEYENKLKLFTQNFEKIEGMKNIVETVKEVENVKIKETFTNVIHKLVILFPMLKKIEKTNASGIINVIKDSLGDTIQFDASEHAKHLFLTAGFPEKGDMSRVKNDLKSDWFREKISHGKSIKILEAELGPFSEFAEKMETVEEHWYSFRKSVENFPSALTESYPIIDSIEKFDYPDDMKLFATAGKVFQTCSLLFKANNTPNDIKSFEVDYGNLFAIEKSIEGFKKWSQDFKSDFSSDTLKIFIEELKRIDLSKEKYETLKKTIKTKANYGPSEKIFSMFKRLAELQKNFDDLINNSQNLTMNIESIVTNSGLMDVSKCLRNANVSWTDFSKSVEYTINVLKLGDNQSYDQLTVILGKLKTMIEELIETEKFVKGIASKRKKDIDSPLLQFKEAEKLSDHLGNGMRILKHLVNSLEYKDDLIGSTKYGDKVNKFIQKQVQIEYVRKFWNDPLPKINEMVKQLEELDESAESYRNQDLLTIRKIFDDATKVHGIPDVYEYINENLDRHNTEHAAAIENSEKLKSLDMDFSEHKGDLNAASLSLDNIKLFFDDFFGLSPKQKEIQSTASLLMIFVCLGIFILLVLGVLVSYGFTKNGRRFYTKLYYYYFGKPQDYEKRWRYSLFMDRLDGKNVLIDAVREINSVNLLNAVKKGAYIDVCNKFGNTPLHVATKRGYSELVEILIKNGADQTFLNTQNKTPEQMIPENYQETEKEKTDRYAKIEALFNKYRKKKIKKRFPDDFPVSSFHIFIEERTDDNVTNEFTTKFQSITSDEVMPTTTHCIVKTIDDEIFETDDINLLSWIFNGVIIVKESWMTDCLKNEKMISKDSNYLVEKIKYKGIVYNTVIQWSNAMAKGTIPYLNGVHVVIVMKQCPNVAAIVAIVTNQGGIILEKFPEKENYNKGAHPYLHSTLGPIFIIHDGTSDLRTYQTDPDKMFTLFTETEFLMFLLKREINVNTNPNPIPILVDGDD